MEKRGTHPIPARRPRLEWRKPCRKRHSRRSAGRMQKPVAAVGARPTFAYINFSIITPSFATVNRANAPSDHGFSIILHPPKDTVIINRNRTHPGGPSAAGMQPRPGNTAPNPTIAPRAEGDSQGAKFLERSARQRLAVPPSPAAPPNTMRTPPPQVPESPRAGNPGAATNSRAFAEGKQRPRPHHPIDHFSALLHFSSIRTRSLRFASILFTCPNAIRFFTFSIQSKTTCSRFFFPIPIPHYKSDRRIQRRAGRPIHQ